MEGTGGLITVTLSTIGTIILATIFLSNSFQENMNLMRTDMNVIRADMDVMRADIRELQDKTARMDAKLELLLDIWDLAEPSPPAVVKK